MTLVILAAGMGSRFGGPKQTQPVGPNGEFIIDYSIYDAINAGFDKVVFIIKEENKQVFEETIGKRINENIEVSYVFQKNDNVPSKYRNDIDKRTKPLGTAHAILCCKDIVKDNFAIINADDYYGPESFNILADYLNINNNPDEYSMVGYKAINTLTENGAVKRGICQIKNGKLARLDESKIESDNGILKATSIINSEEVSVNKDSIVSMNMFGFTPKLFKYLEEGFITFLENSDLSKDEYLIPEVVNNLVEKGLVNVRVLKTNEVWHGITYKEDLEKLKDAIWTMIEEGKYNVNLWQGKKKVK